MALFFYKEKNKDIRAAAYLRLSIEDGDKAESNSIGNQRELIRDFVAERPELHLVGEYADDGYTGTNFERPGFTQMMEDIKSGKINCIIVKDLSRLGRNYIEMGKYLEQIFPMMGIRFIAINDNYDNANTESSDSDSIVVPFKNLLNDSYCRDISIKVRSQLDIKRRKGEFIGGYAMYGYCKDERNKSRLVVDEYAAEIVRSIYRRKLEGMSAKVIAEQLNSEGVLAPSEYKRLCGLNYHSGFKAGTHAKWQAIQVLRILKNEVYTGTMVQGKRQKINYKIKKIRDVEESGWIKVPNMHEAIIPQKLFDTVQEVLKLDTCASKGQQTVNLFSGMVRCGGCGQNMVRRTVSKNGKKYVYLHCITNHNGLGCSSHLISESKLAEVVLAALQGKIQQISGLEQRLDEINEIPKNQRRLKSVEEHMKMLEQEEQKYQTLRRQLYEDMSNGIVSKDEYKEFSRSFNEKVENIRKAKAEMNRQLDSLNNLDAKDISKKVWTSLQRKKEAGYAVGSDAPFGYIRNPVTKRNEIDPETAFYVQLIFQWVLMGVAIFEIAKRLTLLKVPTPREWHRKIVEGKEVVTYKKWGETSVRHMLANQTYVGDTINNKSTQRFFAGQDKRDLSKEQWYVAKNTHPAIIARDDFEKVQEILTKNQKVFKTVRAESEQIRTEYQNDLAGMVFCADCGRSMDFDRLPHGAEESKKVCYYICRARQADDKCIGHQITEKLLKALVMDQLHLFIVRLSDKRKVLEELRKIEDMQNPVYRAKSEIMSLTDKVGQMAKKREQLYADYVAGVVDSKDYQLIREDYSKQYDGLRAALQRAEAKKVEVEQQIREYLNMTSNLEEHLDDFGFDAQLVKSLVQRIEVSADKRIRIVFGFQDVFADLGKESAGK